MAISMDVDATLRLREVFSTSFNTFRRHVVASIILSVIAHIPGYFVIALSLPWGDELASVVDFLCVMIAYGAIIYGALQDLAGGPASIAEAVAIAARRLSQLVGVLVVAWVLFGWVMLLPVNPGFRGFIMLWMYWLATGMYFVAAPVCIAEQVGVGAALSRCRFLTKGRRWQIFVAILVVGILDFAIGITLSAGALPEGQGLGETIVSYIVIDSIWFVLGAFNAVMAAVFYDRLHLAKDEVQA
jgi:hypothetical protein